MNRFVRWLSKMQLSQILTACLVALIFLASTALGQFSYTQPAQAASTASQTSDYQLNRNNTFSRVNPEQTQEAGNSGVEPLKNTANTVREKLNLDEPLPQGTKTFFKQLRGEDVKVEEPKPFNAEQEPQNE